MKSRQILLFLTIIPILLLIFIALKNPQSLYSDSAWQMKALQQFIAGDSPSFNHLVRPSYDDLAVNKAIWITWWPPGTNLLAYPLMAQGIPVGISIRIIAIASFILGSLGWICWFSLFDFPIWIGVILALTIPSLRCGNHALFQYSAEVLVYAYAPWLILITYQFSKYLNNETTFIKNIVKYLVISPVIGLILGFGYILKYSLLFVVLGALIYLGFQCITNNNSRQQKISKLTAYVLVCLFCGIPLLTLNLVNQNLGETANLITATAKIISLKWQNFIYVIANPALAMTDAELLWKMLLNFQHSIAPSSLWIGLIGIPGGILLLWLILRDRALPEASLLAKIVFFTSMAAIFGIWSVGATVSYEARHVVPASLAILPVALQSGYELWHKKSNSFLIKGSLCIAAIFYLAIPLAYSSTSIIVKALETSVHYTPASSQIYNPWLASQDLARVRTELVKDFNEQTDIWYLPEPITALDLPGRAMITSGDFYQGLQDANLHRQAFHTSTHLRVHVLLPRSFEDNGKGLLIRSSFVQAHEWICQEIEGSNYVKWTSTLEV
ncbi:hypothetical protein [Tolypothrix sp. VBCCA 56010]|uniref:hypothetical protein n=1 Tax=Tolypothrix sp. VBCCA 56010 TaxID=3137731 RepID=UPI003D7C5C9E